VKLKRATWKLRAEALRRYRQKHKGSLDRAEEEMNNVLKSKVGRTSKTSVDKSVSAERDFNNTDSCKPQSTKPAAEKSEAEPLDVGEIKDNPADYTAEVAEVEKDDTSYMHRLNVTGTRQHHTGTRVRMSGNKELANDEKTSDECVSMTEHNEPNTVAVMAVSSNADGEDFELESVYNEDASVFDDDLVFEDGCLDYETSSMSVEMFTDRAMSEELLPDGKTQEDASYCHDGSQAVENAKLSLKLDVTGVSVNSDDETSLSANVVHHMKPAGKRLQQDKQHKVSRARHLVRKKDALKTKIHFPEGRNELVKCSGDKKSIVSVESNKHICEAAENIENCGPLQLGETEANKCDSVVADEDLQQRQMSRQSLSSSRPSSSQSRHDVSDDIREQARSNTHSSDRDESTKNSSPLQLDEMEAAETGSMAAGNDLQQGQVSGRSSGSSQVSSQSGILSRQDDKGTSDSSRLSYNRQISETAEGTQNLDPVDLDNVEDANAGCEAADENLKQHLRENSSSLSSQKASQSGIIGRHGSVPLDGVSRSSSSCTENTEWHLATMFENTSDSIDAVAFVNDNTTSERGDRSASNFDLRMTPELFQKSASGDASNEGKSNTDLSSVRSCGSPGSRPRSVNYRDSADDSDEETKSDVMPSAAEHLHSSDRSSDWHLTSLFDDESGSARDTKRSGRESTRSNSSSKSVCNSEWHIRQLFDDDAYLPSRQLSGELHA